MDVKDKRLLYELSVNSRQSARQIAKKIGLSRDAVVYRMKSLERQGILKNCYTVVNLKKLGYRTHMIFFEFKQFDFETEKRILAFLIKHPYVIWVVSPSGRWDIIIYITSSNTEHFDNVLTQILNEMQNKLKSYEVLERIKEHYYKYNFLGFQKEETFKPIENSKIDQTDLKILKLISQNSRIPSTHLAEKLGISHDKVSYRIKKMINSGWIEQFTIVMDYSKMNYLYYLLIFQFNSLDKATERKLVEFLQSQEEVAYVEKTAGKFNFNIDVIVSDAAKLKEIMRRIRGSFGDILEARDALLIFDHHKEEWLPDGVYQDLIHNLGCSLK